MILKREPTLTVKARDYSFELLQDRPAGKISLPDGTVLAEIFLLSSCHTMAGRDVSAEISAWEATEEEDGIRMQMRSDSLIWDEKTVTLRFFEDRILYSMQVKGNGQLADVEYFSGYYTGSNARWGNARFYSGFFADSLFNPEPDGWEQYTVGTQERSLIDMTGVPIPGRDHWFFTPPPFCFVLRKGQNCMTLGISAEPGRHTFTEVEYLGGRGQGLVLRYEGYTAVNGVYNLPQAHLIFGSDEYALLKEFCAVEGAAEDGKQAFAWWSKPIFCGWGAQSALSQEKHLPAPALSNQQFYQEFAMSLDQKQIHPGTVVIDDKWQKEYGLNTVDEKKWPDMKGFIAAMHRKGRKVLLWLKAWDPEGLPPDACICDALGRPQAADPESPVYQGLFRQACQAMLSPEGLDADGFKIDFTARIPSCPGVSRHGTHWGLELMRDYLALVYDEAKAVKQDALIMCHCPHPYLADKLDMIRLNDVNIGRPVCTQMVHRARVVWAAMPGKLIDTDNWPMPDKKSWLEYVALQPELGVPSLYYLWHMDNSPETITDQDLDTVRTAWPQWEEQQK